MLASITRTGDTPTLLSSSSPCMATSPPPPPPPPAARSGSAPRTPRGWHSTDAMHCFMVSMPSSPCWLIACRCINMYCSSPCLRVWVWVRRHMAAAVAWGGGGGQRVEGTSEVQQAQVRG